MPSEPSDTEAKDETQGDSTDEDQDESKDQAQDESQDQDHGGGAGEDDAQEYPGVEDFTKEGDKIKAPEGEFSADDKGFDGSTVDEILEDRKERLSPDNRADETEVSNAGREFDGEKGMFTDEDGYDEAEKKYTLE